MKKQHKTWINLLSYSSQMAITIFIAGYVGKKVDTYFEFDKQWFTFLFIIIAVAISIYLLTKMSKS